VAAVTEAELVAALGKAAGHYVHAVANVQEPRRTRRRRGRRSVGAQRALGRGPHARPDIDSAVDGLAERIAGRMASKGHAGRTVVLRLRFGDYTRATRSATLGAATSDGWAIAAAARDLLEAAAPLVERRGLTLVGVTVTNLGGPGREQLALPLFGEDPS
jgi:DNA polymerase-4